MISTNQLELFSTVPTTVPTTVLYWFLGADGPRTKLLKLTESFSNNSETFSNKSVNVSNHRSIFVIFVIRAFMDFPWIVDFLQQSCRRASRASRQDSQEPQQPIAANITNEAQGLPAISSRLSPAMECSTTPAAESPGPSSTVVGPPAPPLLPMSPSMILAMEFPENEAWLESTEKAAQEAKGASGSKTWRLFGSPSSSSSSAAAAESGRKSPENSFKDDAEPPQGNSNKDEDDATKKSLSALLGFDTAADQLARALGSVAGLGVSPSLLRAQEGFARKVLTVCAPTPAPRPSYAPHCTHSNHR